MPQYALFRFVSEEMLTVPNVFLLNQVRIVRANLLHYIHTLYENGQSQLCHVQVAFDGAVLKDKVPKPALTIGHEGHPLVQTVAQNMIGCLIFLKHHSRCVPSVTDQLLAFLFNIAIIFSIKVIALFSLKLVYTLVKHHDSTSKRRRVVLSVHWSTFELTPYF